jgi:IPT/TIG domain
MTSRAISTNELTSPQTYKVKPKITSFTPPSGPPATLVTITGSGLIQATTVKFGTVKATTFTVISDPKVTAVVPSGLAAAAGKISITTPGGTAHSPQEFTWIRRSPFAMKIAALVADSATGRRRRPM